MAICKRCHKLRLYLVAYIVNRPRNENKINKLSTEPKYVQITPRQRRYALEMINGATNKGQAMIKAGYSPKTAATPKRAVEMRRGYQTVLAALDKSGLTDQYLADRIYEGIEKPIKAIGGDNMLVPDYQVRSKYVEMVTKMRDMYPNDKLDINLDQDITFKVELQGKDESPIIDLTP